MPTHDGMGHSEHRVIYFPPGEPTRTKKVSSLVEAIDLCTDVDKLANFNPIIESRTIIVTSWTTVRNFAEDRP